MVARRLGSLSRAGDLASRVSLLQLARAGLLTTGRIYICKSTSDGDRREVQSAFPAGRVFNDIANAIKDCRTGTSDYVLICPRLDGTNWEITTRLNLNRINMRLVGIGSRLRRPKINATGVGPILVSAVGVEIAGLNIESDLGTAILLQNTKFSIRDCEIRGGTTGGYDLQVGTGGGAFHMRNCIIGNVTDHDADSNIDWIAGVGSGVTIIEDCTFLHKAEAVGDQFVLPQNGVTFVIFRRCLFHNDAAGTTDMTQGIVPTNKVALQNCAMVGATLMAAATDFVAPGGMLKTVLAADVFNPMLAVDGAEPIAADT